MKCNLLILLVLCATASVESTTWYVQAGAPSGGTGTSANPFNYLAAAFAAAASSGDTVSVGPGTYGYGFTSTSDTSMILNDFSDITVVSSGGKAVTIINETGTTQNAFYILKGTITIDGFTFVMPQGRAVYIVPIYSGIIVNVNNCDMSNGVTNSWGSITVYDAVLNVNNCTFVNNAYTLITAFHSTATTTVNIVGSLFKNNAGNPIFKIEDSSTTFNINGSKIINSSPTLSNTVFGLGDSGTGPIVNGYANTIYTDGSIAIAYCTTYPTTWNMANNNFCGTNVLNPFSCPSNNGREYMADSCLVCGGNDSDLNCNGECFAGTPTSCTTPTTYYVSPTGTGTGTLANPFGSVQQAINATTNPWMTNIVMLKGVYNLTSGSMNFYGKPINVTSADLSPNCVVIDCTGSGSLQTVITTQTYEQVHRTFVNGITVRNCGANAVKIQPSTGITITNMIFTNQTGGTYFSLSSANVDMYNTIFSNGNGVSPLSSRPLAGTYGLNFFNCTGCMFYNNFCSGTANQGAVTISQTRSVFTNCAFTQNYGGTGMYPEGTGIYMVDSSAFLTVKNSTFGNNALTYTSGVGTGIFCYNGGGAQYVTVDTSNEFCGVGTGSPTYYINSQCTITGSITMTSTYDSCGSCFNDGGMKDCNGVCAGGAKVDTTCANCPA